jgi:hypothetical protein
MKYTEHAAMRTQQRAIPPLIVDWLLTYGAVQRSHGADKLFFDRCARMRLARDVGRQVVDRLGDLLNTYIVVNEDKLITAGHRQGRIRRT